MTSETTKKTELSSEAIDMLHSFYDVETVEDVQSNYFPDESIVDIITCLNFLADKNNFDGNNPETIFFAGMKHQQKKFLEALRQERKLYKRDNWRTAFLCQLIRKFMK